MNGFQSSIDDTIEDDARPLSRGLMGSRAGGSFSMARSGKFGAWARMGSGASAAVCLLQSAPGGANEAPIHFTTEDLPPYVRLEHNRVTGMAADVVHCVMAQLDRPYEITVLPWARAQAHVREGSADAFFPGSRSVQRDDYAVWSVPIAPQNWAFYLNADSPLDPLQPEFKQAATVTSYVGANMLDYLKAEGYRAVQGPSGYKSMMSMLLGGRLDAVLANSLAMDLSIREAGVQGKLRSVLLRSEPLGIYFAKRFLAGAPGILDKFNAAIPGCRVSQPEDLVN